jgi:hypothetical protein
MTRDSGHGRRRWLEVLLVPLVTSLLIGLVGWWPTVWYRGWAGIEAMMLAHAMLLLVVYATLLPVLRRMVWAGHAQRLRMGLVAGVQRFFAILSIAVAIAWFEPVDRTVFLVWIAAGYTVVALAETIILAKWMSRTEIRACM